MISKAEVDSLAERKPVPGSPVLSVYLDIDQSKAANLNRRFEASLRAILRSLEGRLEEPQRQSFSADAARARQYVSSLEPHAKGLILFCDESENFFWARELRVPVRNTARWSDTPYLLPLLAILDEHERYGVALVDRELGRLFTVFMGEIEEHEDAFAPLSVRRIKETGTDHMLSESRFQHKTEMHAHLHLKHVAGRLEKLVDEYRFDRLLLAGPVEPAGKLRHLLSKRVRGRLVDQQLALPVRAKAREILEQALRVEREIERRMEEQIVQDLIAGADNHHPFTLGLEPTVRALCEQRIWRMVYAGGFSPKGGRCANCGMLFARSAGTCDYCGAAIDPIDDLLERMVERALEQESKVEEVDGNAALRLQQRAGGIGGILRF
jgi:peptide subunit release factor 1 (eRF1)